MKIEDVTPELAEKLCSSYLSAMIDQGIVQLNPDQNKISNGLHALAYLPGVKRDLNVDVLGFATVAQRWRKHKMASGNFAGLQAIVSKQVPQDLGDRPEQALSKVDAPVQAAPISIIHQSRFQKYPPLSRDVEELRKSIAAIGILEPLLVRPHPDKPGELELLAGHTRLQSAEIERLAEVPVKVFDVPDSVAIEIVTATNLQRKVLDKVAETDAILELLAVKLDKNRDEILQLFYQSSNGTQNVLRNPDWQKIEDVLAATTRISADSFRVSRLPLLRLPSEILEAVREGKVEYTKAMIISRIKNPDDRLSVLNRAIAESLTLVQIKQAIKELQGEVVPKDSVGDRAVAIAKLVRKAKLAPDRQSQVDEYLKKIRALLDS